MSSENEDLQQHLNEVLDSSDIIHTSKAIQDSLSGVAAEINNYYELQDYLVLVVMNGGLVTAGQLLPKLTGCLTLDYMHATRYRDETHGEEISWFAKPHHSLSGRHVLIVDDIFDEGVTLAEVIKYVEGQGAANVKTALLLDKRHDRKAPDARADFVALTVPDRYVFGFGMDYKGYLRNLPSINAVSDALCR
ncbi:MAG: hypoxanthine-guanine phosphoribosyltransferase [Cellvibrionaceae bacterium]